MPGMGTDRQLLLSALWAHCPADPKEASDLEAMRGLAASLEEPFSRSQAGAHFTGSAVVVDPEGARVVLLHHAKLDRWLQPGGHAEPGDGGSMERTALREAAEETGCKVALHGSAARPLDVDAHLIPARKGEPAHRHLDVRYLAVAEDPGAMAHDEGESRAAQWLPWEDAIARADDLALKRLLSKARAACGR